MTETILTLIFIIPALYIILPWIIKKIIKIRINESLKDKNIACLTFDDGPDPNATPQILDLLAKYNIKATFFVLGKNVQKYPDLTRSIIEKGHEIGEHSYEHLHAWKSNPLNYWKDLLTAKKLVNHYYQSEKQVLFRPPYGKVNIITLLYTIIYKRKLVFWNLDPGDYEQSISKAVADKVISNLDHGRIILLHDGRYVHNNEVNDPQITIDAVRQILDELIKRKIFFMTVSRAITP